MDVQTFKQSIFPVRARIFRVAQLFLKNREEAEDALQDIMLKLWTNREQLDKYQSVEALAVRMTRNLCLDRLKASARTQRLDLPEWTELASPEVTPYQQSEQSDNLRLMRKLVDDLPEQQKFILHLRDVEEYSFEEIEQMTGLSAGNIRVILSRGRQKLRDEYLKIQGMHGRI